MRCPTCFQTIAGKRRSRYELGVDAVAKASAYLADANEARERGAIAKATRLDAMAQKWLDKANHYEGRT